MLLIERYSSVVERAPENCAAFISPNKALRHAKCCVSELVKRINLILSHLEIDGH